MRSRTDVRLFLTAVLIVVPAMMWEGSALAAQPRAVLERNAVAGDEGLKALQPTAAGHVWRIVPAQGDLPAGSDVTLFNEAFRFALPSDGPTSGPAGVDLKGSLVLGSLNSTGKPPLYMVALQLPTLAGESAAAVPFARLVVTSDLREACRTATLFLRAWETRLKGVQPDTGVQPEWDDGTEPLNQIPPDPFFDPLTGEGGQGGSQACYDQAAGQLNSDRMICAFTASIDMAAAYSGFLVAAALCTLSSNPTGCLNAAGNTLQAVNDQIGARLQDCFATAQSSYWNNIFICDMFP